MSEERFEQVEGRLDRVEALVEQNAQQLERLMQYQAQTFKGLNGLTQVVGQLAGNIQQLTERIDQLTERVDGLTAASEKYDRVLDYLLKEREENDAQG
jgi:methyl-accepting chemotaxis protein